MGQERLSAKDICDLIRTLKLHTLKILNIINTLIKSYQDLLEEDYYDQYLVHKEQKSLLFVPALLTAPSLLYIQT